MATVQEHLESAQRALNEEKDPQEALRRLTYGFRVDATFVPFYTLASQSLHELGGEDEAQLFDAALADFESVQPFYDLGYHFVDVGFHHLAVPFLERAHQLGPDRLDVAIELALTYTHQFQPERAKEVLEKFNLNLDFWAAYEYFWARLLCNETEEIGDFLRESREGLSRTRISAEMQEEIEFALDKMEEILNRLAAFPNPPLLVRDWHFIQYGAAVLDYCDDSVTEDGLTIAGGRWVAVWLSMEQIALGLRRLRRFLAEFGHYPRLVLGLPDRDSEIVARAAAAILEVPFDFYTPEQGNLTETLIVAADNRQFIDGGLAPVQPGQILYALNLCWLEDGGATPDVAGLMSQVCYFPWLGGAIQVNPETQELLRTVPDTREPEAIATDLVALTAEDNRFEAVLEFYRPRMSWLKAGHNGAWRLPFRVDSPVPGSYFV